MEIFWDKMENFGVNLEVAVMHVPEYYLTYYLPLCVLRILYSEIGVFMMHEHGCIAPTHLYNQDDCGHSRGHMSKNTIYEIFFNTYR